MTERLTTDPGFASSVSQTVGTPFYLVSENRLIRNIRHLQDGIRAQYPNTHVSYSVKSNNLGAFVRACIDNGVPVEVVSRAEYDYVTRLGADLKTTIYNGPAKTAEDMTFALSQGSFVNVDSLAELRALAEAETPEPIGIRVPATLASGAVSRFGIDLADPDTLAEARALTAHLNVTGLHVHHSSHRHAESYGDRIEQLLDAADVLGLDHIDTLDIGGGFSSPMPPEIASQLAYKTATFDEYGDVLGARAAELLGPDGPRLVLEPGIGVLANCATYVTRIGAIKRNGGRNYAVVDGSIFEVNPLRSSIGPPIVHLALPTAGPATQIVGATCMEIDVLGDFPYEPTIGDLLSIENVGSYTTSLAPDFIIPRSPVVSADTGDTLRLRSTIDAVGLGPAKEA
ncbi:MAG: hypothetical protein R2706_07380 [Acidimicrobiales bacterium]